MEITSLNPKIDDGFTAAPADTFDIVPTHLAVQAMRDNGYKNAAYALAELMDNAIEAGATHVELLCAEKEVFGNQRNRRRVDQIAVLDNGVGMPPDVLRMALQFGNGTRLDPAQRSGMGRFGMGLPAASISQCRRVDVWTWQNGVENAHHTYLDLDEIGQRKMGMVPPPRLREIEPLWKQTGKTWGESGTLVVWSNLDKCRWSSSRALINNTEALIGRMYRRFLNSGKVRIRFAMFDSLSPLPLIGEKYALPNDPGYLMDVTSCPRPWDTAAMFQPWSENGGGNEIVFQIPYEGKKHPVKVRFSYAKSEARAGTNAGGLPHGQHAKGNVGVSIVREGRELEMEQGFVQAYNARERWWGVEIEFPSALDDVFGVSNNKQSARYFADVARMNIAALLEENNTTIHGLMAAMSENDDPHAPLLEIANRIRNSLETLRGKIGLQKEGTGTSRSGDTNTDGDPNALVRSAAPRSQQKATEITVKERQNAGHVGESDKGEALPAEQRQADLEAAMIESGTNEEEAKEKAEEAVHFGLKYVFSRADLDTAGFFSVRSPGGAMVITLNTNHPAYQNLLEVLENGQAETDPAALRRRLESASDGLKLLLMAWARYEDEQPTASAKQNAKDARNDWGRIARDFLASDD